MTSTTTNTNDSNDNNSCGVFTKTVVALHQQTRAFFRILQQQNHEQQQQQHFTLLHGGRRHLRQMERLLASLVNDYDEMTLFQQHCDTTRTLNMMNKNTNNVQQEEQESCTLEEQDDIWKTPMRGAAAAANSMASTGHHAVTTMTDVQEPSSTCDSHDQFLDVVLWTILSSLPILPSPVHHNNSILDDDGHQDLCRSVLSQASCLWRRLWNASRSSSIGSSRTANYGDDNMMMMDEGCHTNDDDYENNNDNNTIPPLELNVHQVETLLQRILGHTSSNNSTAEWSSLSSSCWIPIALDACTSISSSTSSSLHLSMPLCFALLHHLLPQCTHQLVTLTAAASEKTTMTATIQQCGHDPDDGESSETKNEWMNCRFLIGILLQQVVRMSTTSLHQQQQEQQHQLQLQQQQQFDGNQYHDRPSLQQWLVHVHLSMLTTAISNNHCHAATTEAYTAALADVEQLQTQLIQYLIALADHAQDSMDHAAAAAAATTAWMHTATKAVPENTGQPSSKYHDKIQQEQLYDAVNDATGIIDDHHIQNHHAAVASAAALLNETVWDDLQQVQVATDALGLFLLHPVEDEGKHDSSNSVMLEWQELLVTSSSSNNRRRQDNSMPVSQSWELWKSLAVFMMQQDHSQEDQESSEFFEIPLQIAEILLQLSHQGLFGGSQQLHVLQQQQQQQDQQEAHWSLLSPSFVEEEMTMAASAAQASATLLEQQEESLILSASERQIVLLTFLRLLPFPSLLLESSAEPLWLVMTHEITMANRGHENADMGVKRMVQVVVLQLMKDLQHKAAAVASSNGAAGQFYFNYGQSKGTTNHDNADMVDMENLVERLIGMLKSCDCNSAANVAAAATNPESLQQQQQNGKGNAATTAPTAFDPFQHLFDTEVQAYFNIMSTH